MAAEEPLLEKFDYRLILGQIDSVDSENGTVTVSFLSQAGQRTFNMPSPHHGRNSWIRAYPEAGSIVLIGLTVGLQQYEILKVLDVSEKTKLLLNYATEVGQVDDPAAGKVKSTDKITQAKAPQGGMPFRKMNAGDIEAVSGGRAFWWISNYGANVLKGGIARLALEPSTNSVEGFAAEHLQMGLDARITSMADSAFFGVVRRPVDQKAFLAQSLISASQISEQIKAVIGSQTDKKLQVQTFKQDASTKQTAYSKSLESLVTKSSAALPRLKQDSEYANIIPELQPLAISALKDTEAYLLSLKTLSAYGAAYGYSQADFDLAVKTLSEQLLDLKTASVAIANFSSSNLDTANLTTSVTTYSNMSVVKVPEYQLEAALDKSTKEQSDKLQAIQTKVQDLVKASTLQGVEPVESRHVYKSYLLEQNQFCKEWRVSLDWKGKPGTLYSHNFGHVYDNDGIREKSPSGKPLRSRQTWFTDAGNTTVLFVDVDGNVTHILSPDATQGYTLTIPSGNAKMTIAKDLELEVGEQCFLHVNNKCSILVDQILKVEAESIEMIARKNIKMVAPDIQIGDESTQRIQETGIQLNRTASAQIADVAPSWIHP